MISRREPSAKKTQRPTSRSRAHIWIWFQAFHQFFYDWIFRFATLTHIWKVWILCSDFSGNEIKTHSRNSSKLGMSSGFGCTWRALGDATYDYHHNLDIDGTKGEIPKAVTYLEVVLIVKWSSPALQLVERSVTGEEWTSLMNPRTVEHCHPSSPAIARGSCLWGKKMLLTRSRNLPLCCCFHPLPSLSSCCLSLLRCCLRGFPSSLLLFGWADCFSGWWPHCVDSFFGQYFWRPLFDLQPPTSSFLLHQQQQPLPSSSLESCCSPPLSPFVDDLPWSFSLAASPAISHLMKDKLEIILKQN